MVKLALQLHGNDCESAFASVLRLHTTIIGNRLILNSVVSYYTIARDAFATLVRVAQLAKRGPGSHRRNSFNVAPAGEQDGLP